MKERKLKSYSAYSAPNHFKAPGCNKYWSNNQFKGTVIANTNITAAPRPTAVATFLETAKYEHIPKKTENTILSIKIDLNKKVKEDKKNNRKFLIVIYPIVLVLSFIISFGWGNFNNTNKNINALTGIKKNIVLANQVGIIDADYYENESNDGHIMIAVRSFREDNIIIQKGDRIAQGIFEKYLTTFDDEVETVRTGGVGSTK